MTSSTERERERHDRRVILQGTANYTAWKVDCQIELQKDSVAHVIKDKFQPPVDLDTLDDAETIKEVREWLETTQEVPDGGFSIQKINSNKKRWKVTAIKEFNEYETLVNTAFTTIYRSIADHIKPTIATASAKEAWNILEKTYGSGGFEGVYTQADILAGINYSEYTSIESYTNKFKGAQQALERHNVSVDE